MFPRLVLGYLVALPLMVVLTARSGGILPDYTIAVTMQSGIPGYLQVFFDSGGGFSEARSATVPIQPSDEPHEYRLKMPPGRYHSLRIDPGSRAGRYVIWRAAIVAADGTLHVAMPLAMLAPVHHISIVERSAERLVVETPAGSTDPQLLYVPESPIFIPEPRFNAFVSWRLAGIALLWLCGIDAVWLVEKTFRRGARVGSTVGRVVAAGNRNPRATLFVAAFVATVVSSYPVLLLGRSLVTPNIGGTPLLYDQAPFTPGSTDLVIENGRGSDVGPAMWQDVPHSHVQREALRRGEIPLWNRYNAAGRPLWAQGLTFLLDPLHWLVLATSDPSLGWDLKFVAHRFVFAFGVGLAALTVTGGLMASVVAAAAAPFAGIYAYRLNHPAAFALTYAPWVLLAWFQLAVAADRYTRALIGTLLALFSALVLVASTPKEGAVTLLGAEMTGVLAILLSRGSWRDRGNRLLVAGLAGVAVLLITAPHWLIFLRTLRQSFTAYDTPYVLFAAHPQAVGFFLGPLMGGPVHPGLHLLALVLTIAALTASRRLLGQPAVLACSIGAAVLIAIAFGALPASVLVRIPLVGNIWHIDDVFVAAAIPLVLMVAAFGADVLEVITGRRAALTAVAAGIVSWWLFANVRGLARGDDFEPWAVLLIAPAAVAVPLCCHAARLSCGSMLPRVAAVGTASVLLLPGGLHTDSGISVLDELLMQPRPRVGIGQESPAVNAVHHAAAEPARVVGLENTLFPGSQVLYGLEGIGGADPLEVPAYRELVDTAGISRMWPWHTMVTTPDVPRLAPLLDMLNVGFLLARADHVPHGFVDIPVSGPDRLRAGRRANAWPRAFFVDGATTYADAQDLLRKVAEHGKPLAGIQSSDRQAVDATRGLPMPSGNLIGAQRYELTVNSTSFVVCASGPGVAVLTETFLPDDFRATLNGQRVPYFRVNHAFKGVVIPSAGDWEVKFEYRPLYWTLSLVMAGFGFVLLVGLGLSARRPRDLIERTFSRNPAARESS
jgi:hypothetical protein